MLNMLNKFFILTISLILSCVHSVFGGALKLDETNFDSIIGNNELVFINFYADWCRFSNLLAPTWDEAAEKVNADHPNGKVVIGKVDCDSETSIASRFHITKYPTLKLLRNGQVAKREYRGQRSAEALSSYIGDQLKDPINKLDSLNELKEKEKGSKRIVIGYFDAEGLPEYENFRKIAINLREDCNFYALFGEAARPMHPPGHSIVAFKSTVLKEDEAFTGNINTFDELSIWATERCIPLVREITFQNAEELTEEGLPFLILFHNTDDEKSIRQYTNVVQKELADQKQSINILTADGLQFAHPLHHLGKSKDDLPLIAIDSFRHMYLFPDAKQMEVPGKLKQFVLDLQSGKLHREFHYGPDPTTSTDAQEEEKTTSDDTNKDEPSTKPPKKPTSPPESTFKKLGPSKNRYTLLKDEL